MASIGRIPPGPASRCCACSMDRVEMQFLRAPKLARLEQEQQHEQKQE